MGEERERLDGYDRHDIACFSVCGLWAFAAPSVPSHRTGEASDPVDNGCDAMMAGESYGQPATRTIIHFCR